MNAVMRVLAAGSLVVLTSGVAGAQSPIFRRSQTFGLPGSVETTFYVNVVAVADIGAPSGAGTPDGNPDLITANSDGQAAVLLGNGDGTFTTGRKAILNIIPTSILLADFDGDQVLDLIASDTGNVEFLRGRNDGSFAAPGAAFPAGRGPAALVAIDLNNDKKLDLIVVDDGDQFGSGAVTILLGNGNGTFMTPGRTFNAGAGSTAVALGDFNNDTEIDLAVANEGSNDITILHGTGGGGFGNTLTIPVGLSPVGIAAEDLNGDHLLDLVVVNNNSDNVQVLDGKPDGTFKAPRSFPTGTTGSSPIGLVLADMNLDGHLDVVTPNSFTNDASVLLGDGKGNFGPPRSFVADAEPVAATAHDFNGDNIPDVVTINKGSQIPNAAVLLGQGDGSLSGVEDVPTGSGPTGVIAGDIDNDGVADLIVANGASSGGSVTIYAADSSGGFAPPKRLQSAGDAIAVGSGDFNGDGILDLVAANTAPASMSVFLGSPGGKFGAAHGFPIGTGASALTVGDWNRDNHADVAIARQAGAANGSVDVVLSKPDGSFGAAMSFSVGVNPTAIDWGDFNRDGKRDLVVGNGDGFSIFLGSGDGAFHAGNTVAVASPGVAALAVADFDHDGADDVAVARRTQSTVTAQNVLVIYGDGQGGFSPAMQMVSVGGVPSALAARDFTGDLIPDLLVTDFSNGVTSVFVSSSSRTFALNDNLVLGRSPSGAIGADFDGDGRYDAAVANGFVAGTASVLTNISAPPVIRGDGNGDGKVTAADAVSVMRELDDGNGLRVEDVQVAGGTYPAAAGIDANGDGFVNGQDALAVAHRLFPRL